MYIYTEQFHTSIVIYKSTIKQIERFILSGAEQTHKLKDFNKFEKNLRNQIGLATKLRFEDSCPELPPFV